MNPAANSNVPAGQPAPPAFTLDDALFTLFKHKRIILICFCLGLIAGAVAYTVTPVIYSSRASLLVSYVNQDITSLRQNEAYQKMESVDNGENVLAPEEEILASLDTAEMVATNIGPQRVLAFRGGGDDPMAAAAVIRSGITVVVGRQSPIMTVFFENPDRQLVRPVLSNLIQTYLVQSVVVHSAQLGESVLASQMEEVDTNLAAVETQLNHKLRELGVVSIDSSERVYDKQTEQLKSDLISAQTDLRTHKQIIQELDPAALSALDPNQTNALVPPDQLDEYNTILGQLSDLAKQDRDLAMQGLKPEHPNRAAIRENRREFQAEQKELEQKYPSLAGSAKFLATDPAAGGVDISDELAKIRVLEARVDAIGSALGNVTTDAFQLYQMEPQVAELKRKRDELIAHKNFLAAQEDKDRDSAIAKDDITNIKIIDNPTPPVVNYQRRMKLTGACFGVFFGFGLVVGFLMDLVFDRTIRRSVDIKRHLHLPVFLTIPNTSWTKSAAPRNGNSNGAAESADGTVRHHIAPWEDAHHLHFFTEGLRERLVTYFDINNLTHKPKLVAVAGCDAGAGVSTLAAGVASSLSKIGDGNVLLVDMTNGQGVVKPFYKGKPGAAEPNLEEGAEGQPDEELSAKAEDPGGPVPKILPKQFTNLVPVLEAKNYEYIVFDMPPVSPTSVTPRLASHMDLVLLVLESGKTGQHSAVRAGALLAETRATTVTVLNKCRRYVPERLSPEL